MDARRLLIVEDDADTRKVLRVIFAQRGWEVIEAGTVSEGMAELARTPQPDCVILDLTLPDGRGEAILKKVRAERLKTRVAVCTGVNDPARLQAVTKLRPEALLSKPWDVVDLWTTCHVA